MQNKSLAAIVAWCLYDWASSSFSIIVTTFIFATYFTTKIASNEILGTYQWANAMSIAGVIIALTSPLFGAIADYGGYHKRWLFTFTLLCVAASFLLWFSYPNDHYVYPTLLFVILGTIGFEVALVFYNAYLPHIAPKNYLGRISGWGWGTGYVGGIVALTLALYFLIKGHLGFLDTATAEQVRICGPFVAIWYFVFALPLFILKAPMRGRYQYPLRSAIRLGVKDLIKTLKELPSQKDIFIFLISHMIYTDGLNTLFAFGGIYAAGTFGLSFQDILLLGITMNVAAGFGALVFAWVDDLFGSKETVLISLVCMTIVGFMLLFVHSKETFWILAAVLCLFVGPVQSASRTLMVRLIAMREMSTEMFGLYAFSGRITSFLGPWLLGFMTWHFGSQRAGMAVIVVFFVIGALSLLPVHVSRKQQPALAKYNDFF